MNRDYLADEFGMEMKPQLADVQGRVLPAPILCVGGQDNRLTPRDGSWDMRNKQFYSGVGIHCWAVVLFMNENYCRSEAVRNFASTFKSVASREGLRVTSDPVTVKYERPTKVGSVGRVDVYNSTSDWLGTVFLIRMGQEPLQ